MTERQTPIPDETQNHEDTTSLVTEKIQHKATKKMLTPHTKSRLDILLENPGFPWMIIALLFTLLVTMFWREHYSRWSMQHPEMIYSDSTHALYPQRFHHGSRNIEKRWGDMEREMEFFRKRQEDIFERMKNIPERVRNIPISFGKYSGTRIIDNNTFSYTLDIGEKSITGSLFGSDSGAINALKNSIEGLGYKVENSDGGFTIQGDSSKKRELLELFR